MGDKWKNRENISRVYDADSLCPTITAGGGGHHEVKIVVPEATKKGYAIAEKGNSITTSPQIGTLTEHGVRKLTPRECFRLMGFSDGDFDKAQAVCSDTQLYKQAGNSIVVQVLEGILKNLIEEVGE